MEFAGRVGKYEICAGSNQCKSKSFSIEAHTKDGLRRKMIPRKHAQHPIHRIRPVVDGIRKNNHLQLHNDKIRERGNSVPARAWLRGLFRGGTATKENFGTVVKIDTEADFDAVLETYSDNLVVLNCSMTYCGPCKVMYPTFELFAENYADAVFCYCVGDSNESTKALLSRLGIQAVPHFEMFRNGKSVGFYEGKNKQALRKTILSNLEPGEAR
mmetsp:Transcript_24616/g.46714  ORF Transcript_24616/g.46714 Transcript_24616/m.46714 type:complete len:214 (+) Transcript_24616:60-701(+)